MTRALGLAALFATVSILAAQPSALTPDPNAARPIDGIDTVWIEEMTWMEVRDALKDGKTTVLVPTGGVEQNGPYLATGKHNYILRGTCEAIARKHGKCLVAPVVAFVPEGNFDPPTEHMKYPGTISLSEETFEKLLTDICSSLQVHGFTEIILLGDSGGNQKGMKAVASQWKGKKARVHFIPEYYDYPGVAKWLESQGIKQKDEGLHDDFAITAQMLAVGPTTVRMKQRIAKDKFRINGVDLAPAEKTIEWGKKIIDFRAEGTVKAMRKAIEGEAKK